MIGLDEVAARFPGLTREEITLWIERRWVRAEPAAAGAWVFTEMDVARVRLVTELRVALDVTEDAMPLVLSLIDQLYDARRTVQALCAALDEQPAEVREAVMARARERHDT
jgi:chaperone modulatory protein CbpM